MCDRQKIRGNQGVSLDALVGIFTRIGREVEGIGVSNTFALAERVAAVIEDARPLLTKVWSACFLLRDCFFCLESAGFSFLGEIS